MKHFRAEEKTYALDLYQADCFEGMKTIVQPLSVDVVFTSPPYNLGIKYSAYNDQISRQDYLEWLDKWADQVKRVLKTDGSLFLNVAGKPSDPWGPFEAARVMRDHFFLLNTIHWIKSIYIENDTYDQKLSLRLRHYKPINSKRFINDMHEYVFHFSKTGQVEIDRLSIGVPYKDKTNVSRWQAAQNDLRCRGNTWYIPYKTIKQRVKERPHPASFPPKLVEMGLKLHGLKDDMLVMDPFLGIGNSALACRNLKVNFIGFEIDPEYFRVAVGHFDKKQLSFFEK